MSIFNNIYNIDFDRLVLEEIPKFKRHIKRFKINMTFITPFKTFYSEFVTFRDRILYTIEHTPQVGSIENVLNDAYDDVQRRIYIEDGEYVELLYIYRRVEDNPIYIHRRNEQMPLYIHRRNELEITDVDFVVVIPLDLNLSDAEIIRLRSLVDFYRLPDKTYTLRYE